MKPLTSAPRIHGSSFRCPATETAWNFKSFLGDPRFMKASFESIRLILSFLFDTWPFLGRKKNSIRSAAQMSTPRPAIFLQPADLVLIPLIQGQCRPEGFQVSQGYQDTLNIVRAHKLETKHNIHRLQASNSFCSQFLLLLAFGL